MENLTTTTLPELAIELLQFGWLDYTIFSSMFILSAIIGIYFGCFGTKQSTTSEYLLGSRTMSVFPVAVSLTASHLSGITLLGVPSEVYLYGTQFWMCALTTILVCTFVVHAFLPVFYHLKVETSYQYLQLRFDERIRSMALLYYAIYNVLYIPITIYVPALAFNQVSGIGIHKMTPIICAVCIFYTTIGGLKGVVWTDTLQFIVTLGAMFTVFFIGIQSAGGVANIWKIADQGERLEFFNMDMDPTSRTTFWGIAIGLTVTWITTLGTNPSSVQRFMAMPSLSKAKRCMMLLGFGIIFTKSLSCFSGLIMYAKYHDCDPYTSGKIRHPDQLLPFYVLDVARHIPGLPGLFMSGIFSTALSTMSTNLNTLGGIIYKDFIQKYMPEKTTDTTANNIIKSIVVIIGVICVLLVFLVEHLGNALQIVNIFAGVTTGSLVGIFALGMLFPLANATGVFYGSIIGLVAMFWMVGAFQYYYIIGAIHYNYKSLSIENCGNTTVFIKNITNTAIEYPQPFILYRLSSYWYPLIGAVIVIFFSLLISRFGKDVNQHRYNKNLYSPLIHRWIDDNQKEYQSVKLNVVANGASEDTQ